MIAEILRRPEGIIILIFVYGSLANLLIVAGDLAIWFSLRQKGIVGEGSIIGMRRSVQSRRLAYYVRYQVFDPNSERYFQHTQEVSFKHYEQWNVGDVVNIVMLSDNFRISRLVDYPIDPTFLSVLALISLIFPIYFFSWANLPLIVLGTFTAFIVFLLWINLGLF